MRCVVCDVTTQDNRWAKIRAHSKGWFEQKDGTAYCPAHVPAWVQEWRARHVRQHGANPDQASDD